MITRVSAETFLESNTQYAPELCLAQGGLRGLVKRLQYLIDQGIFRTDADLQAKVSERLDWALRVYKTLPPTEEGWSSWAMRLITGRKADSAYLPALESLSELLRQKEIVNCAHVDVLFLSTRSLAAIVEEIGRLHTQNDVTYLAEVRERLYARIVAEWDRQTNTVIGWVAALIQRCTTFFTGSQTVIERACQCLMQLDNQRGINLEGLSQTKSNTLDLYHLLWIDDAVLQRLLAQQKDVEYLSVEGCLGISSSGLKIALKQLPDWKACIDPEGGILYQNSTCPIPKILIRSKLPRDNLVIPNYFNS